MDVNTKNKLLAGRRKQIIELFCKSSPPVEICFDDDHGNAKLQEWIINNSKDFLLYTSGISIMDSAWEIAESDFTEGTFKE